MKVYVTAVRNSQQTEILKQANILHKDTSEDNKIKSSHSFSLPKSLICQRISNFKATSEPLLVDLKQYQPKPFPLILKASFSVSLFQGFMLLHLQHIYTVMSQHFFFILSQKNRNPNQIIYSTFSYEEKKMTPGKARSLPTNTMQYAHIK